MKKADLVIDLGFGDGGKGVLTDNLCDLSRESTLVVRFSGGHNAGHTVIRDGVKHVFSSFGAGSLKNCPSFFTEDTVFYLNNMFVEWETLVKKGFHPTLTIHPLAHMTTPYDVAWNRMMEGINKHGSCGAGIAATMKRNLETPHKLYAVDLLNDSVLRAKLKSIHTYYQQRIGQEHREPHSRRMLHEKFDSIVSQEERNFFLLLNGWKRPFDIAEIPAHFKHYIFEGSQGIMLDMDHGIFPNVTYANTTSKNAIKYCERLKLSPEIFYVSRCYTTRHGNGWMPNEDPISIVNNEEEINVYNKWQTHFRTGEIDYGLLNQAVRIDRLYHGWEDISTNLVVGCMDQRPGFDFKFHEIEDVGYFWINNSAHAGNLHD